MCKLFLSLCLFHICYCQVVEASHSHMTKLRTNMRRDNLRQQIQERMNRVGAITKTIYNHHCSFTIQALFLKNDHQVRQLSQMKSLIVVMHFVETSSFPSGPVLKDLALNKVINIDFLMERILSGELEYIFPAENFILDHLKSIRLGLIRLDLKKQKAQILISFFLGERKFGPYTNFPTHLNFTLSFCFSCKKNFKFYFIRHLEVIVVHIQPHIHTAYSLIKYT